MYIFHAYVYRIIDYFDTIIHQSQILVIRMKKITS